MTDFSTLNPTPIYECVLPSTGKKVKFRPFLVKEERALLAAQESEDVATLLATLHSVVSNCLVKKQELAVFDIEYLFLQIRAKSVEEFSKLSVECAKCNESTTINIDIRKAEVIGLTGLDKNIKLSDTLAVKMRFPTLDALAAITSANDPNKLTALTIAASIDTIFTETEALPVTEESDEKLILFLDSLTSKQYDLLETFVRSLPTVTLSVPWTCPACSGSNELKLQGINDFFS
jgi:hypothetical protein